MDDLYDDLDNYNEINKIDELRKENTDLKFKIEQHEATIENLKKENDRLTLEFKKLSFNYSSLLKTSRAEVARKTQLICNLNAEKDKLVLNSLNKTNKALLNIKHNLMRDKSNSKRKDSDKTEIDSGKKKTTKDVPDTKKFEAERNRGIENRMPSSDTVTSSNTDDSNRLVNTERRADPYPEKGPENKEVPKSRITPQSIRSRRKSMPSFSKEYLKFSTDEEFEELYSAEELNVKEWAKKEDMSRKLFDNNYNRHKASETSGIDDKYSSYHESSRETSYRGRSRYSDRYRPNKEKYDPNQRFRKHFSPERNRREPRDHSDDRRQRIDFGRSRVLESPPPDKMREYDPRRNRDRRFNYEHQHNLPERGIKRKDQPDYEEPASKKVRTDLRQSRPFEDEIQRPKVQEISELRLHSSHPSFNLSCMSPDYVNPEFVPAQPIREIKHTATTKLEDPRFRSKRYVKNDTTSTLCSLVGKNIEIVPINKKLWNIETVKVPEALQRPPPSTADNSVQLTQTAPMDIDPVSNISVESGEILSPTHDSDIPTDDSRIPTASDVVSVDALRKEKHSTNQNANVSQKTKYKIPKLKKVQEKTVSQSASEIPKPLEILMNNLLSKCENKTNTSTAREKQTLQNKETKNYIADTPSVGSKPKENKSNDGIKLSTSFSSSKCQQPQSARELVAGDLELSDETCDDSEMQNISSRNKVQEEKTQKVLESRLPNIEYTCYDSDMQNSSSRNKESLKPIESCLPNIEATVEEKSKEISPEHKKKKTKKKSHKHKITDEISKPVVSIENGADKKTTKKKSKESKSHATKDRHAKFSELFGDSSSLITPEDLGLAPAHVPSEKYLPIFEDAQDAVDVNVESRKVEKAIPVDTDNQNKSSNISDNTTKCKSGKTNNECRKKKKNLDEAKPDSTAEPKLAEDTHLRNKEQETVKNRTETTLVPLKLQSEAIPERIASETHIDNSVPETIPKNPDVVKTVIISTGVQSQNDVVPPVNNIVKLIEDIEKDIPKAQATPIHALATSTPYKGLSLLSPQTETDSRPESCSSGDIRQDVNEASLGDQSSQSNSTAQETDAPDFSIRISRRRRVKK